MLPDGRDRRQLKLTSVDSLLVLLTRFGLCSEKKAMRVYQEHRYRIFYRYMHTSLGEPRSFGSKK